MGAATVRENGYRPERFSGSPPPSRRMYLKKYGPYQVGSLLGEGGTGAVLRGFHESTDRPVALKVPKLQRLPERQALRREIGILSRMNRAKIRGVVTIVDHGVAQGVPWYAMELLDGRSLGSWKEQIWSHASVAAQPIDITGTMSLDALPQASPAMPVARAGGAPTSSMSTRRVPIAGGQLERVLNVMWRVAEILALVHAEGVVHGDLTPSNIFLRDEVDPVLIDFGTGLAQLAPESFREVPSAEPWGQGTPAYLAPEVLRGEVRDARCDLYAFGCILYEVLTGSRPFSSPDSRGILQQQLYATPARLSERVDRIPTALEDLVLSLLVKDPVLRTPRADDVSRALAGLLPHRPSVAREAGDHATLYRPRLRGRERLLARLTTRVADVGSGRGGFVLLSGPSGIGKTRLMNEAANAARPTNVLTIWCRAGKAFAPAAQNGAMPSTGLELFSAVVEHVLESEERAPGSNLAPNLAFMLQAVSKVMPLRGGGWQFASDGEPEVPARARTMAFDGLLALLQHVAASSGLVLLIDDLQWADELSAAFLRRCAGAFASAPILVIANYRTEGPQLEPDLDLAALADPHIALAALEAKDTERIAKDILATDTLPAGLFAFLYKHAGGNPFFVAEYTRAAVAKGLLARVDGAWSFQVDRAGDLGVPSSVEGLLALRLQRLSMAARTALQQASVLGDDFDAACFESLVNSTGAATELLEELVAREILQAVPPAHYRFTHDALREAQERTLSSEQRTRYHGLAAEQLERRNLPGQDGMLGYHWASAGQPRRALAYLERAASDAHARHTLERAGELYRLGIEQCLHLLPDTEALARLSQLTEALADVLRQQARHLEARELLEQLSERLAPRQHLVRARVWRKVATSHWTVHEYARASAALDRAEAELAQLSTALEADGLAELIEIRLGRFEQLYFSGQVGSTLDALVEALAIQLERHGSNDQRCRYYFMAASHVMLKHRYAFTPEALALAERGLEAAVAVAPQRTAMARFILGFALMLGSRAQCRAALAYFEDAGREAERIGEATLLSRVRTYHTITALRVGEVDVTGQLAELALEAAQEAHLQPYLGAARVCQGWVAWRRGDAQRARELLEAGRECWRGSPHGFPFGNLAIFPLLELASRADDFETARGLLDESSASLPALPATLASALQLARQAIDRAAPVEASTALAQVIRVARELAFA